jgi:1-acyl-sn-glycerol-3-phosphate acyltransferase
MSRPAVVLRLAIQALFFLLVLPLQRLAIRFDWRLAGWLPVLFHRLFLRLFGIKVNVHGAPARSAPALVLANHMSWLDIAVLGSLGPLSFVAKSEVAGWPVISLFARLQRTVFIDRARKSHTAEVNAAVAGRLAAGDIVVLFPEGTTSDGNRVLPFRSALVGAARVALADGAHGRIDLQPLAITYLSRHGLPLTRRDRPEIAWYGDMDLAPHLAALLGQGPLDVAVTWCEPIPFEAATDRKRATAGAEAAIRRAIHVMTARFPPRFAGPSPVSTEVAPHRERSPILSERQSA